MVDFESLLRSQAHRYPAMQPQDACKAVFQAVLGPGHLIDDESSAEAYIRDELKAVHPTGSHELLEPLGGRYFRLHLGALKSSGLSIKTVVRMLLISARAETGDRSELEEGANTILRMADEGKLPFSLEDARQVVEVWQSENYPMRHHSRRFNEVYQPSYRVMKQQMSVILPMLCRIDSRLREGKRTVLAVDGMAGAGKTTFASVLKEIYDCAVFHADDFFPRPEQRTPERLRQPGGNLDRERLREEILRPISEGATRVVYRPFDCVKMELGPSVTAEVGDLVVVEGSYCMHPDLRRYYTDTAFLRVSPEEQRRRIEVRNPDKKDAFFEKWIPMENAYIEATQVQRRCEFLLCAEELAIKLRQR